MLQYCVWPRASVFERLNKINFLPLTYERERNKVGAIQNAGNVQPLGIRLANSSLHCALPHYFGIAAPDIYGTSWSKPRIDRRDGQSDSGDEFGQRARLWLGGRRYGGVGNRTQPPQEALKTLLTYYASMCYITSNRGALWNKLH
jgi:hypothetical protein